MVKFLQDKYPLGSYPGQKSPGLYIDGILKENIDILAETIVNDLQFLGVCCSSTYEVRSGKSTFLQQVAEYYTHKVNTLHNLNLTFNMNNIVFNSSDLIDRANTLPKYSCLILDENDEIDEHYFSKLSKDLRRFFRKSGQLNLFIIIIAPNFFQLRKNHAISRSNFLLDVRFEGKFERGFFRFFNFDRKRELYIKGKKTENYNVVLPNFSGRFVKKYVVDEDKYKREKKKDLVEDKKQIKQEDKKPFVKLFWNNTVKNKLSIKKTQIAKGFGIGERTLYRWISQETPENK